ncbi:hypothetical protein FVW20_03730 [Desulfovibrio oxamicus]|uniref:Uncharacterized protein n=1 Tax=Nitratidesulfovibrio oxamicus TaxID=32016 RepID=A0ABS0J165_9BACT|nr:hypothetical protein [Nitratidesulfovibrio oxamicus]MBG3876161.1 hypothetical protein [Nitratidesulfovibrio oxamicus]
MDLLILPDAGLLRVCQLSAAVKKRPSRPFVNSFFALRDFLLDRPARCGYFTLRAGKRPAHHVPRWLNWQSG